MDKLGDIFDRLIKNKEESEKRHNAFKCPLDRAPEELSYDKKLREIILDLRAEISQNKFIKFEPQLLLAFDIYDTLKKDY